MSIAQLQTELLRVVDFRAANDARTIERNPLLAWFHRARFLIFVELQWNTQVLIGQITTRSEGDSGHTSRISIKVLPTGKSVSRSRHDRYDESNLDAQLN